ncbi:MAG: hypothetical protein IJ222_05275 [Bacteroidales bacterium]|nr:hypothetical protein [Bacteroidales bacterium]
MKKILIYILLFLCPIGLYASQKAAVALVVDSENASAAGSGLRAYAEAIERDGKTAVIISLPKETNPQLIRDTLRYLHENNRLEGAVLIGDIPVPMIRRAHHLATAFKMNPSVRRDKSSIPSDRFYDDFSLKFTPLGNEGQLWYYDLSPEGAQRVECDIYTARIKPSKTDPAHSYAELISEYLFKAAEAHGKPETIDHVFHFGGHGNSSESFNARIDENRAYYEMFGLDGGKGRVDYINFDEDRFVRGRLQKILAMEDIDVAHLHTHGGVDAQYISKEPYSFMASEHAANVKYFLRGKMRSAKDKEKTRASLKKSYDVPDSWLDGWDDPEQQKADSVRAASVDISLADLDGFVSGPALILLDACFNGAFLHDDYVAARYAFGHGSRTIAVTANSVNIIQDHWKAELIGLLKQGVCIGNWIKNIQTLESHLFGDPTYTFAHEGKSYDAQVAFPSVKSARKMLSQGDPSLAGFGIKYLYRSGDMPAGELLRYLREDPRMNVRMEALTSEVRNPYYYSALVSALRTGLSDSYELVRRMSARYASICCDPALEDAQKEALDSPLVTSRVRSHLMGGLYGAHNDNDAKEIGDKTLSVKDRGITVSAQRNKCNPAAVDPMLALLADKGEDKSLRLKTAEALGWYVLSVRRDDIHSACKTILEAEDDPDVKDELTRTIARLDDLANCLH